MQAAIVLGTESDMAVILTGIRKQGRWTFTLTPNAVLQRIGSLQIPGLQYCALFLVTSNMLKDPQMV